MSSTDPEHEAEQITKPTDNCKIKRALWRYSPDGTYNNEPINPDYFRNYWDEKRKFIANLKFECEYYHKLTMTRHYERHQKRKSCIEAKNKQMESLVQ